MSDSSRLKKVACPSCGAPLLFGAGEITIRCQFCHAVVERPLRPDEPAKLRSQPDSRPPARVDSSGSGASSRLFYRLMFMLASLICVAVIGIVVFLVVRQTPSGSTLIFNGPAAVFPTDRPEGPDFIALVAEIGAGNNRFVRVDPVEGKVVWRGKEFEDSSGIRTIAVAGNSFLAVEGRELHAYSAVDGTALWQAKLSDELDYCDGCLTVSGGIAVALTRDYVIEAFDVETGSPLWERRMDGYTAAFTVVDGGVWVIDKVDGEFSLIVLGLTDGTVQRKITPDCERRDGVISSTLGSTALFLFDPDPSVRSSERSVYLFYGWFPGCIERWDAASATRIWQHEIDEGYSPSSDFATLSAGERVYFSYQKSLWAVSKEDGEVRTLADGGGDYELVPAGFEQETLILRTKRTRGTAQFGLRGVDPATGRTRWEYAVENGAPLDPPDPAFPHVDKDQSIWSWRMIEGKMRIFIFQSHPSQIAFDTLDPIDGSSSGGQTLALDISNDGYFGPYAYYWREPVLWVIADSKILAVDVSAASVLHRFP